MRLLAVNAVDHIGGAEIGLLRLAGRLATRGWDVTMTSPHGGSIGATGFPWLRLDVGGVGQGEGARAVGSWPRTLRLSQRFDGAHWCTVNWIDHIDSSLTHQHQ